MGMLLSGIRPGPVLVFNGVHQSRTESFTADNLYSIYRLPFLSLISHKYPLKIHKQRVNSVNDSSFPGILRVTINPLYVMKKVFQT